MPIYEYRCTSCEKTFSRLQRIGADPTKMTCPECGSAQVERLLSAFASTKAPAGLGGSAPSGCGPST